MIKKSLFVLFLLCFYGFSKAQINNLKHEPDYQTSEWGKLGEVQKFGNGEQSMILLPGWGFDWTIFKSYIDQHKEEFTFYAVTFPGFGNTSAPPMPEDNENYSDLYWTKGILKGLKDLISKENIEDPVLMSYFTYSNHIAMRMALDYPDLIKKVIIVSGMAKYTANYPSLEPRNLAQRIAYIEKGLAPRWFKTVSKSTWDEGNFYPITFSKDSLIARKYWDQMSAIPIPVMVRYLCEFYCTDISLEFENLQVPTLVVVPAFTPEIFKMDNSSYIGAFFHYSWQGAKEQSDKMHLITLTNTHAFILEDQPEKLDEVIDLFLKGGLSPRDVMR